MNRLMFTVMAVGLLMACGGGSGSQGAVTGGQARCDLRREASMTSPSPALSNTTRISSTTPLSLHQTIRSNS